jgi:hypothetical protein
MPDAQTVEVTKTYLEYGLEARDILFEHRRITGPAASPQEKSGRPPTQIGTSTSASVTNRSCEWSQLAINGDCRFVPVFLQCVNTALEFIYIVFTLTSANALWRNRQVW